jgi:hypothetical protein
LRISSSSCDTPAHDLVGDDAIDPFRDEARGFLRNRSLDDVAIVDKGCGRDRDRLFHQRLGLALRPEQRQQFRRKRRCRDGFDAVAYGAGQECAELIARQCLQHMRQRRCGPPRDAPGVLALRQPAGDPSGCIDLPQLCLEHQRRQKVVGDETAERAADAALVVRHDRGVRYRQAERMAEHRNDREPVGAGPDHPGFGEGLQVGQPGPLHRRE